MDEDNWYQGRPSPEICSDGAMHTAYQKLRLWTLSLNPLDPMISSAEVAWNIAGTEWMNEEDAVCDEAVVDERSANLHNSQVSNCANGLPAAKQRTFNLIIS